MKSDNDWGRAERLQWRQTMVGVSRGGVGESESESESESECE
jgi:hypothetical protein